MTFRAVRYAVAAATALLLGTGGVVVVAAPAFAAIENYDVTLPGDDGSVGTLRWAIDQANGHDNDGVPDTITIEPNLTVTAEDPLPTLTEGVNVVGGFNTVITRAGSFTLMFLTPDARPIQDFIFNNITFQGFQGGHAILAETVNPFDSLTFNNSSFNDFNAGADAGGAVRVAGTGNGPVTFSVTDFSRNSTLGGGGAVSVDGAASVTIAGNGNGAGGADLNSAGLGGAFDLANIVGDVTVQAMSFTRNEADGTAGGAVHLDSIGGAVEVIDSVFGGDNQGNESVSDGGAVALSDVTGTVTVSGSTFRRNGSGADGGAIASRGTGAIVISDSQFADNIGSIHGGAASLVGASLVSVSRSEFGDASATDPQSHGNRSDAGGALWLGQISGEVDVVDTGFFDNVASGPDASGGAIYAIQTGSVIIGTSRFVGNSAGFEEAGDYNGGAVYVDGLASAATVGITASRFESNHADSGGGAVYVGDVATGATVEIDSSTFSDDDVSGGGQGLGTAVAVRNQGGLVRMLNTTVDELRDAAPVAVYIGSQTAAADLEILSSTLNAAGRVLLVGSTSGASAITNSIFAAAAGDAITVGAGDPLNVSHSLLSSPYLPSAVSKRATNAFGIADMRLAPLSDNGGPTPTRLPLEGSPALEAGDNAASYVATTPFDQRGEGFPRVLGYAIDIGAVEAPASPALPPTGGVIPIYFLGAGVLLLVLGFALRAVGARRRKSAGR